MRIVFKCYKLHGNQTTNAAAAVVVVVVVVVVIRPVLISGVRKPLPRRGRSSPAPVLIYPGTYFFPSSTTYNTHHPSVDSRCLPTHANPVFRWEVRRAKTYFFGFHDLCRKAYNTIILQYMILSCYISYTRRFLNINAAHAVIFGVVVFPNELCLAVQ